MSNLLLTVRFLADRCHGLLDRGGPPEWPPSPFRLFQALVAGVARRGELVIGSDVPENTDFTEIGVAISWLQTLPPPIIIAPKSKPGQAITRFVPNNDGDKKPHRQERLAAKHTVPTLFLLEPAQKPEVHYVWDISGCANAPVERIRDAARSLTALGWGVDMAFADAACADEALVQSLKGIRWYPKDGAWRTEGMLRTPRYDDESKECTLCDLRHCHFTAINRIEHGKPLKIVDKPRVFGSVLYTSTERPIGRPYAVFRLVDANGDIYRYPHSKLIHVAGMTRHAALERMKYDPPTIKDVDDWVNRVVRGKRDELCSDGHRQFSYVPIPSIGHEHADAMIRNIMLIAPLGMDSELDYLARKLDGESLTPKVHGDACAATDTQPIIVGSIELQRFNPPAGKFIQTCYLATADTWHTVTPVILPGHNDHKAEKTKKLIQRALEQSGIETSCEFTWQSVPFVKNCLSAHKYDRERRRVGYFRPSYLSGNTAVHLRIRFGCRKVIGNPQSEWVPANHTGPIVVGAGRHCGFGIMAAEPA